MNQELIQVERLIKFDNATIHFEDWKRKTLIAIRAFKAGLIDHIDGVTDEKGNPIDLPEPVRLADESDRAFMKYVQEFKHQRDAAVNFIRGIG